MITRWKYQHRSHEGQQKEWKECQIIGNTMGLHGVKMTYLLGSKVSDDESNGVITAGRLINRPGINKILLANAIKACLRDGEAQTWKITPSEEGVFVSFLCNIDNNGEDEMHRQTQTDWRMMTIAELQRKQEQFLSLFISSPP